MEWKSRDDLTEDIPERSIPTYHTLSYEDFLVKHLATNTPFLLSPAATASWPTRSLWGKPQPGGISHPILDALRPYGDQIVPVADTQVRQWGEFARSERPLREVLDLWGSGEGTGLYVKDWHLIAELEAQGHGAGEIYSVPECFRDDWLNPPFSPSAPPPADTHSDASTADFRFTYIGPPGTFTPLHRDVYASYSWSANVVGRKVWWLFPPGSVDAHAVDRESDIAEPDKDEEGAIRILQEEGEVIFVPSGWHHKVVNVDFCISINHNFFCSITLSRIFEALEMSQKRVEDSIEDVKDMIKQRLGANKDANGTELWRIEWLEEVQSLLERDAGWGWSGFWRTVLRNVQTPSAPPDRRPPDHHRNHHIRSVIDKYRLRDEFHLLKETRDLIEQLEKLLTSTQ